MGEQLRHVAAALAARPLDPRGGRRVSVTALPAGQALVCDVPDQDVLEDELALPGEHRRHPLNNELAAAERPQNRIEVVDAGNCRDGTLPEATPHDGSTL